MKVPENIQKALAQGYRRVKLPHRQGKISFVSIPKDMEDDVIATLIVYGLDGVPDSNGTMLKVNGQIVMHTIGNAYRFSPEHIEEYFKTLGEDDET